MNPKYDPNIDKPPKNKINAFTTPETLFGWRYMYKAAQKLKQYNWPNTKIKLTKSFKTFAAGFGVSSFDKIPQNCKIFLLNFKTSISSIFWFSFLLICKRFDIIIIVLRWTSSFCGVCRTQIDRAKHMGKKPNHKIFEKKQKHMLILKVCYL